MKNKINLIGNLNQARSVSNHRFAVPLVITAFVVVIGLMAGCDGLTDDITGSTVINITALPGVTPPAAGEDPVRAIESAQYTGAVSWEPAVTETFALSTPYTATITLTAKTGFTLKGVAANFFTIAGASSVSNAADSGIVTAVFPKTGDDYPEVINIAAIPGVRAPVTGAGPVTAITATDQYIGSVSWSPAVTGTFAATTMYTATITLTAKPNFTLKGVAANFFTVAGATTVSNSTNSGTVFAVFPATGTGGSTNGEAISYPIFRYDDATGNMTQYVPAGAPEFYAMSGFGFDWNEDDPFIIEATIINSKLTFTIDNPVPFSMLGSLDSDLKASSASEIKGLSISYFVYEWFDQYEGEDKSDFFILANKNNLSEVAGFVYVNHDTQITGIAGDYWDVNLKRGWNTVKYNIDRATIQNFTPTDDFAWLTGLAFGGNDDMPGMGWGDTINKMGGTISVTLDGQFPLGGFVFEAFQSGQSVGKIDKTSGPNPVSWKFDFPLMPGERRFPHFELKVYPDAARNNSLIIYPEWTDRGNQQMVGTGEHGEPLFEVTGIVLQASIETMSVSVTASGTGTVNAAIYASGSPFDTRYGMLRTGSSSQNLILPKNSAWTNPYTDSSWLWFYIVPASGQNNYISKGRINAGSAVTLNTADMYIDPRKSAGP